MNMNWVLTVANCDNHIHRGIFPVTNDVVGACADMKAETLRPLIGLI